MFISKGSTSNNGGVPFLFKEGGKIWFNCYSSSIQFFFPHFIYIDSMLIVEKILRLMTDF